MSQVIHVALVGGQWIQIDEKDRLCYLVARCLRRRKKSEDISASDRVDKFRKHLSEFRKRKGSPLKREYDGNANMIWRCVNIDGQSQWVEVEVDDETPCKLWGFDSDSSDDESSIYSEIKREALKPKKNTASKYGVGTLTQQATTLPREVLIRSLPQRAHGQPKRVSLGKPRIDEIVMSSDDEQGVKFAQDSFLDEEESEDRRHCFRFGGLKTIESLKETKLRRRLLAPSTKSHDCQGCAESTVSSDDQTKKKVSFGSAVTVEIPEEFVTTIDKHRQTENSTKANGEHDKISGPMKAIDNKDKEDAFPNLNTQLLDEKSVAMHSGGQKDMKSAQKTTIKFSDMIIVKESPANHLPTLKSFPDFCTVSKPIFPPYHKKDTIGRDGTKQTPLSCEEEVKSCMNTAQRSKTHPASFVSFPKFVGGLRSST